ncbi:hypothetical protein RRG08_002227 [Elysia crispata]|uniref:Uncharacterized protein n=1 Tax=Elysia crispata TaxID=231223 RepID=A0AAE0ZAW2_9GAST|nr:hypothetical protein RRG08_002227 [Elysia crispata]
MAFVVFFVSIFLLRIPMFMKKRIILAFDPVSNATRVVYKEVEDGGLAEKMNDIISGNILNWASFVIVITCLVVMVTKLQASARFRLSNALPDPPSQPTVVNNDDIHRAQTCISEQTDISPSDMNLPDNQSSVFNNHCHHQSQAKEKTKNDAKTQPLEEESCPKTIQFKAVKKKSLASDRGQHNVVTPRETQVVRSVILVAIIFVTCQTPLMVTTLARRFESQFDDEDDMTGGKVQKYVYLFGLCANISQTPLMVTTLARRFEFQFDDEDDMIGGKR